MIRCLLVNSVKFFHERNTSLLTREGFHILTAVNGMEALEIHSKEQVNLIIADLDMPDISGERLCSLCRNDPRLREVSIILVYKRNGSDLERVEKSGANAWLTIPIDSEQLLNKIGCLLAIPVRQQYRVLLRVTVLGEKGQENLFCTSKNISATGMLIETEKALAVGEAITCSFFLSNASQVVAEAEIVRAVEGGTGIFLYGIRFTRLEPAARNAIEAFVASAKR